MPHLPCLKTDTSRVLECRIEGMDCGCTESRRRETKNVSPERSTSPPRLKRPSNANHSRAPLPPTVTVRRVPATATAGAPYRYRNCVRRIQFDGTELALFLSVFLLRPFSVCLSAPHRRRCTGPLDLCLVAVTRYGGPRPGLWKVYKGRTAERVLDTKSTVTLFPERSGFFLV